MVVVTGLESTAIDAAVFVHVATRDMGIQRSAARLTTSRVIYQAFRNLYLDS